MTSTTTSPTEITRFIDEWLLANREYVSDVAVDFALDLRNLVAQLEQDPASMSAREPARV